MADFAHLSDGTSVDTVVDVEIVRREDRSPRRVLIDGVDMTYKIVPNGITINPGDVGIRPTITITFATREVKFTTEPEGTVSA